MPFSQAVGNLAGLLAGLGQGARENRRFKYETMMGQQAQKAQEEAGLASTLTQESQFGRTFGEQSRQFGLTQEQERQQNEYQRQLEREINQARLEQSEVESRRVADEQARATKAQTDIQQNKLFVDRSKQFGEDLSNNYAQQIQELRRMAGQSGLSFTDWQRNTDEGRLQMSALETQMKSDALNYTQQLVQELNTGKFGAYAGTPPKISDVQVSSIFNDLYNAAMSQLEISPFEDIYQQKAAESLGTAVGYEDRKRESESKSESSSGNLLKSLNDQVDSATAPNEVIEVSAKINLARTKYPEIASELSLLEDKLRNKAKFLP